MESLRRASLAELRKKYQEVFQEETRCTHREHLFRRIAWRLQALAEGDLSERARGRAHQIAQDSDLRINAPRDFFTVGGERVQTTGDQNRRQQDRRLPLPGALLTRKWKGRTIVVEVLAKGFRYENRSYSSLSAIATALTGTRWNGLALADPLHADPHRASISMHCKRYTFRAESGYLMRKVLRVTPF